MGIEDFLKATARIGSKGQSNAGSTSKANVNAFDRGQLDNAAASMSSNDGGAVSSFLDNLGSFFRPAGTFATAATDYVGGDGTMKNIMGGVRAASQAYKDSGLSKPIDAMSKVPGFGYDMFSAPTGDLANTDIGRAYRGVVTAATGVDPDQQKEYLTDKFRQRVAQATEGSGFMDTARSIAENRNGQKQDNLVERTLGKLPGVGGYFDKATPSVEDKAVESGATAQQAMFMSMLNPLEWLNAEGKVSAEAKLAKAGAGDFRKGLNRFAAPVVDPMGAAIDWALPGKAPAATVQEVAPTVNAEPDSIRQAFANNLGVGVDEIPNAAPTSAVDDVIGKVRLNDTTPVESFVANLAQETAKPVEPMPQPGEAPVVPNDLPVTPLEGSPPDVAATPAGVAGINEEDAWRQRRGLSVPPADPFAEHVQGIPSSSLDNLPANPVEPPAFPNAAVIPASKVPGLDVPTPPPLPKAIVEPTDPTMRALGLSGKLQAPPKPGLAAEAVKALDPELPQISLEAASRPERFSSSFTPAPPPLPFVPWTPEAKVAAAIPMVREAAAKQARLGADIDTTLHIATEIPQRQAADLAQQNLERLAALESSVTTLKNSDMPLARRKAKLASLAQDIAATKAEIEAATTPPPRFSNGLIQTNVGIPLPSMEQLQAANQVVGDLAKRAFHYTSDARAELSRWFSSTSYGRVDAATVGAIRDRAESVEGFSRTLADAYHKVVEGDLRGIIGDKGGVYTLAPADKVAIRDFMGGRVVDGAKVDEAALVARGLAPDVIETAKLVRGMMDQSSDALMAETHNLPLAWFTKLNNDERQVVANLAQTASKPTERAKYLNGMKPGGVPMKFIDEAKNVVDKGYGELNAAGHWLDGENPRDMLLDWAPYLSNRGTYQPLLYRLFEHGVMSKGDDAMQLYLATLKAKGVVVPPDLEAFLYSNWMAGGAGGANASELQRLKARNPDMPAALKQVLQEIEDPSYSYATGIYQVNKLRQTLTMRRWMAGMERFVSRPGEDALTFMERTGHRNGDFSQMNANIFGDSGASTNRLGALKDRYVHNDFWDLAYQVHALPGVQNGGNDAFMKFNREVMQRWKFWHTVANPASHIRQGVQNLVSIWLAGGLSAVANIIPATHEYRTRGNLYAQAKQYGLLGNKSLHDIAEKIDDSAWKHLDFNAGESFVSRLGTWGDQFATLSHSFRVDGGKKASELWQYADEMARMALFKTYVDKGWDAAKAAEAVKGEVYGGVRNSRADRMIAGIPPTSGIANPGSFLSIKGAALTSASALSQVVNIPFWGSTRFVLEQSLRNLTGMKPGTWRPLSDPGRMARAAALGLTGYGLSQMWRQQEDLQPGQVVRQLPDYMRSFVPMNTRVPDRIMQAIDDKGKVGYIDWSWLYPWGDAASGKFNPKTGRMESSMASGGMVQMSPIWKPLIEVAMNKDMFREEIGARSEIYNPLDTTGAKARKSTAHLWRSYLPPWAPNLAGGAYDALTADGGVDGKVDAKEAFRAFMQGVANDSGNSASKVASGIYNSFDYWWQRSHPDGQTRIQVSDYMGREQYLVKSLADALAIKVSSVDVSQIEKRRRSAQMKAAQDTKHYYQQQRSLTTNPETIQRLNAAQARDVATILSGKPSSWYDEAPEDTWRNVRNAFADTLSRRSTPTNKN